MFSSTAPLFTATGSYFGASACHCAGLPRNASTSARWLRCLPRRKIDDSRAALLVLQVSTRNPFGYPAISSNSSAGGESFFTFSSLIAPSSRFQSAPRTSFNSPSSRTSSSQERRSSGFAVMAGSIITVNGEQRAHPRSDRLGRARQAGDCAQQDRGAATRRSLRGTERGPARGAQPRDVSAQRRRRGRNRQLHRPL